MASTPQDFTSGLVLTDTMMDKLPQGIVGWAAPVTASVGPTSGGTELDVITAAAVTPAQTGRRWRLRFHCRGIQDTVTGDLFFLRIKEGSTVLNETHFVTYTSPATINGVDFEAIVDSPSTASHTYKVTIQRSTGTGTATVSATSTAPILFYVEDAGAA